MIAKERDLAFSPNPAEQKKKLLADLIPEAFADGRLDVAALKRALGESFVVEGGERYALTWAGRSEAYKVLQSPSGATLRPQRERSINFDEAQHLFIEGENLEVLKVLQKAYFGKVKLIYIDPPYNTGSDSFIYPDRFQESKEEYLKRINDLNDNGTLMREGYFRRNKKENGHFHSNWLSMMLPRLYVARNLLREDGLILVSCDDNEVHNLRCLMNEIFGEENFVAQFVWKSRQFVDARAVTNVSTDHEYVLAYGRSAEFSLRGIERDETKFANPDNDPRGPWMSRSILGLATKDQRPNLHYDIVEPGTGRRFPPHPMRGWRYEPEKMAVLTSENRILFPARDDGRPREKKFRSDLQSEFISFPSVIDGVYTADGTQEIRNIFRAQVFDFPKPSELIARFAGQVMKTDDLMLDFFAGSGTCFDAIVRLNANDSGNRRLILVQLPEQAEEHSEAFRAGLRTVSEIGRERLRRVIENTRAESDLINSSADHLGFKSFLLTPSNFKQWRGDGIDTPEQLAEQMEVFVQSEKNGAEAENILYELLLKFGQELTTPIEMLELEAGRVFGIRERQILFLLEKFTEAMIDPLLGLKPREIVALDAVFQNSDQLKTNLDLQCRDADVKFTCI